MIRPTIVASTPRLFSLIYDQYMKALQDALVAEHQTTITEEPSLDEVASAYPNLACEPTSDENRNCLEGVETSGDDLATTGAACRDQEMPAGKETPPPRPPPALTRALSRAISVISESNMTDEEEAEEVVPQLPVPDFNPHDVPYELKKKVMESFRGLLGGREQVVCIGGAAVSRDLVKFLQECFNGMVVEGYGTTEVSVHRLKATYFNHVGAICNQLINCHIVDK